MEKAVDEFSSKTFRRYLPNILNWQGSIQSPFQEMEKAVDEFSSKTFRQYLPKRSKLAREYPKPSSFAVAVPILDHDIKGAWTKKCQRKVMLKNG